MNRAGTDSWVARVKQGAQRWAHRATHTTIGQALHRFNHFRGTRLAGTVTFYAFLSVFPILVLAFSVTLRVAGADGVAQLEQFVEEYVPGVADELSLQQVRRSAASLQLVGAVTLLITGLGWVDATRASVRSMWGCPTSTATSSYSSSATQWPWLGSAVSSHCPCWPARGSREPGSCC